MNFEKNYQNEFGKYTRHNDFLECMLKNKNVKNINWDTFWSWYYHSNINSQEALENSKY